MFSIICDLKEVAKKAKIISLRKWPDIRYPWILCSNCNHFWHDRYFTVFNFLYLDKDHLFSPVQMSLMKTVSQTFIDYQYSVYMWVFKIINSTNLKFKPVNYSNNQKFKVQTFFEVDPLFLWNIDCLLNNL